MLARLYDSLPDPAHRDVLTCPAEDIRHTKVLTTYVGGQIVYEKKPL